MLRQPTQRIGGAWPYVRLMRPPNLATAAADVLAGFALTGLAAWWALPWLVLASVALYAGGVVMNDVFDARLDAVERPERPIPSGEAPRATAALWGAGLLGLGVASAWVVGPAAAWVALAIAGLALFYDGAAKHHDLAGPLSMGLCRGLNLLLGAMAAPAAALDHGYLLLIPLLYIGAVTTVSRGEVHGGSRGSGFCGLALMGLALAAAFAVGFGPGGTAFFAVPFLAWLAVRVLPSFWEAFRRPGPGVSRQAVKAGVLSLIVLDAAIAATFAGPLYGLAVLLLMPLASRLAEAFAVT